MTDARFLALPRTFAGLNLSWKRILSSPDQLSCAQCATSGSSG